MWQPHQAWQAAMQNSKKSMPVGLLERMGGQLAPTCKEWLRCGQQARWMHLWCRCWSIHLQDGMLGRSGHTWTLM